jgi:hypothetical protein
MANGWLIAPAKTLPTTGTFPPVIDGLEYLYITRLPHVPLFTVYFPNGDTYDLSPDQMERYVKMMGCEKPTNVLDYIWNFNSARFHIPSGRYQWVPMEEFETGGIWK